MSRPKQPRLTPEKEADGLARAAEGMSVIDIAVYLGFKTTLQFYTYRKVYPDFGSDFEDARTSFCDTLEDQLLSMPLEMKNARVADVLSRNIQQVLKYRNPKRYGDKVDLNVTQTIDIAGSLDRAERRVLEAGAVSNVVQIGVKKSE